MSIISQRVYSPGRFQDICEFKSILQLFGFTQLILTPTRITNDTESLIDIIPSNNCASIKDTTGHNLLDASGNLIT